MSHQRDWRDPGSSWVRTSAGWKLLKDADKLDVKGIKAAGENKVANRESKSKVQDSPISTLAGKCAVTRLVANTREVHQYCSLGNAIRELHFFDALQDEVCFRFICRFLLIAYAKLFTSPRSSLQISIINLTFYIAEMVRASFDRAKATTVEILLENGLKVMEKCARQKAGEYRFYTDRQAEFQKWKQAYDELLPQYGDHIGLEDINDDCLRKIIQHLSDPCDVVQLGCCNKHLHHLTEERIVWIHLLSKLFEVDVSIKPDDKGEGSISSKESFKLKYLNATQKPYYDAVCLCLACNCVYWKHYHHCASEHKIVSPERFLELFHF